MSPSVFDVTDYKDFLRNWIESSEGSRKKRTRSEVANALQCHLAYLSRVLNGDVDLSLEQGLRFTQFAAFSEAESDFFLLLLNKSRAGTADLVKYYEAKIKDATERRSSLKNRLDYKQSLSEADEIRYFSAWYFSAIHLLLRVPQLQTKEAISRYLSLSPRLVGEVLEFLSTRGLAVEKKGRYSAGTVNIHLGDDALMIANHHTNWRMLSIEALRKGARDNFHYSAAMTFSAADVAEIRKALVATIEKTRNAVKDSKDEVLYCCSMDLFQVGAA